MAQRKTHAKSRLGCLTCKRRHVKSNGTRSLKVYLPVEACSRDSGFGAGLYDARWPYETQLTSWQCNEERPKCDKCLKLGLRCEWATRLDDSISPATAVISPAKHAESSSSGLALADLRLLHQWLQHTAPATFFDGDIVQPWLNELVQLGFEQPYLLHAMLAVAAVHKAATSTDPDDLCLQASTHIDIALRSLQAYIKEPDAESYAPIFATASLMVLYKLAVAQVEAPVDPIADTYEWIRLLRGVSAVVEQFKERLHHAAISTLLEGPPMAETTGEIPGMIRLRDFVTELPGSCDAEACLLAVDNLHTIMLSLEQDSTRPHHMSRRLILSWPMKQQPAFIELLSSKDPTALVILAHYAVVFHACEKQWVMRNWARWIVDAVRAVIDPSLHSWLAWPEQILLQEPADSWHWPKAKDDALPV